MHYLKPRSTHSHSTGADNCISLQTPLVDKSTGRSGLMVRYIFVVDSNDSVVDVKDSCMCELRRALFPIMVLFKAYSQNYPVLML